MGIAMDEKVRSRSVLFRERAYPGDQPLAAAHERRQVVAPLAVEQRLQFLGAQMLRMREPFRARQNPRHLVEEQTARMQLGELFKALGHLIDREGLQRGTKLPACDYEIACNEHAL